MLVSRFVPKKYLSRILKILSFKDLCKTSIPKFQLFNSIVRNRYIERDGFTLSNYGVWLANHKEDKTFKLAVMGYRNNLDKILKSVDTEMIFVDIGANQGVFSLIAALNKNFLEIHAFEPNTVIIQFLRRNLDFNYVDRFFVHEYALSTQNKKINFNVPKNHSGAGAIGEQGSGIEVDAVNRSYVNQVFGDVDLTYFLKVDVEGSEYMVLLEMFNSNIASKITHVFVEINQKYDNYENLTLELLKNMGFKEKYKKRNLNSYDAFFVREVA